MRWERRTDLAARLLPSGVSARRMDMCELSWGELNLLPLVSDLTTA